MREAEDKLPKRIVELASRRWPLDPSHRSDVLEFIVTFLRNRGYVTSVKRVPSIGDLVEDLVEATADFAKPDKFQLLLRWDRNVLEVIVLGELLSKKAALSSILQIFFPLGEYVIKKSSEMEEAAYRLSKELFAELDDFIFGKLRRNRGV